MITNRDKYPLDTHRAFLKHKELFKCDCTFEDWLKLDSEIDDIAAKIAPHDKGVTCDDGKEDGGKTDVEKRKFPADVMASAIAFALMGGALHRIFEGGKDADEKKPDAAKDESEDAVKTDAAKDEEKPLPCPFCGKEPRLVDGVIGWQVECRNTKCRINPKSAFYGQAAGDRARVIREWNTRA